MYEEITTDEKDKFAEAMISVGLKPLEAGQLVYPDNFTRAAMLASCLHSDKYVIDKIEVLKKKVLEKSGVSVDEKYIEDHLKKIIEGSSWDESRIKALEKLMDLKGLSKRKEGPVVQVVVPKVMEVPTHGTDDEWASECVRQQQELLNVSRSRS